MSSVVDSLTSIWESIKNLPNAIIDGIKSIFVPDEEVIKEQYNHMLDNAKHRFNLNLDSIEYLNESLTEQPLEDTSSNYYIHGLGNLKLTFLDTSFLKQGIEFFRPLIRGFVVFLLILYNYKQLLTLIGQDPTIAHNAQNNYQEWRDNQ